MFPDPEAHRAPGHPLGTGALSNTVKLLLNFGGFQPRYFFRVFKVLGMNLGVLPFRWYEKLKWDNRVAATPVLHPPIFILGHWRCGTTHLHNLLVQDKHFGFISNLQAFSPELCIETGFLLPLFKKMLPAKRPFDNLPMAIDFPQEEEFAMGAMSLFSFYHGYFFPRAMNTNFNYLLFQTAPSSTIEAWQQLYLKIIKKATLIAGGKPLVIKNPMNMVRIPWLLALFPEAKFIHIYRNPYRVFYSTVFTFKTMIDGFGFWEMDEQTIEENVFQFYAVMMQQYWKDRKLIPNGHLVEIQFEALEQSPLEVMEKIYHTLHLPGFHSAKTAFEQYLTTQANYQKNVYVTNPETDARIRHRWGWIIDRLGYSHPKR